MPPTSTAADLSKIIRKRHIALLQSLGRLDGAIAALVDLLDVVPVDAEAWSQLAGLYFVQSHYTQAIYSLEEVLLVTPNAWNVSRDPKVAPLRLLTMLRCMLVWVNSITYPHWLKGAATRRD